jgi:hypothetical protein
MVMLVAPSGPHEGQPIWSCSTYPTCRGTIAIAPDAPRPVEHQIRSVPGAPAPSMIDALKRWWTDLGRRSR